MTGAGHSEVVVVAKSAASAILEIDEEVVINHGPPHPFSIRFWTNYDSKFDTATPTKFCAEGRGPADNLDDAGQRFVNAARAGSSLLAFIANADIGPLKPELIFDASPDRTEHEYLQIVQPDPPLVAIPNRRIDIEAVTAAGSALAAHPELIRLRRAIVQYSMALSFWAPGQEIQCLAHLYMGVEALTKAQLNYYLSTHRINQEDLVHEWKIDKKHLDAAVRLRLIFHGDQDTYAIAKKLSDGFEHGYLEYADMYSPAREVVVRTARHLRRAALEMLGLECRILSRLLGKDFDAPKGPLALVQYLRGVLIGPPEKLAASDERYPLMQLKNWEIKSVTRNGDGQYSFTPKSVFTAKLGDGISFQPQRFEVWDGSTIIDI
ncbi:hypothetical protein [Rhodopseudomonas sp.]|uniref:hypothetical protein n=1 Tax=Rhodopseudomonas sp. TaxID=1078 RepID=UPI003B3BDB5A